jgi:branched-chain amino acid transport system ATP-binding protein
MPEQLLRLEGVHAGYGHVDVLRGIDLSVAEGEIVALLGSNGAGKSTLLKAIVGLVPISSGVVTLRGTPLKRHRPERLVRDGVALGPEGRWLFGPLSVAENLALGASALPRGTRAQGITEGRARVERLFPVLAERAEQPAETLSGGEQQMLAVGRALMGRPRLLLLDEPSLGLAPKVIAEIFGVLDELRTDGVTIVLVEQDASLALQHADRGAVMRTGRIALQGGAAELLADDSVRSIYLGSWPDEGEETA